MLIPALFVADAVRRRAASSPNRYDVIVFCEPSVASPVHREWMERRGIILCDTMDLSHHRGVGRFSGRLTEAALMKLSIAGHLAGRYEKLLYLDADLTIHGDVGALFSLHMADFALSAVPAGRILAGLSAARQTAMLDQFQALGMSVPYRYFNAGVILMDVAKWNDEDIGGRALSFVRANPDLCVLLDEDALNAILDGNFLQLSPIWNMSPLSAADRIVRSSALPVIIHHSGNDKPWRRYGYQKRLFPDRSAYRLYEAFLKDTPWPGWLGEQWTGKDLRANVEWEIRRISRRLRGKLDEPSAAQRRSHAEALARYCMEERFADVEQGLVTRRGGKLCLAGKEAVPA
ncbi:MAG: glycosyltransferase family 8 protein [Rhizobiaceae bacterium]